MSTSIISLVDKVIDDKTLISRLNSLRDNFAAADIEWLIVDRGIDKKITESLLGFNQEVTGKHQARFLLSQKGESLMSLLDRAIRLSRGSSILILLAGSTGAQDFISKSLRYRNLFLEISLFSLLGLKANDSLYAKEYKVYSATEGLKEMERKAHKIFVRPKVALNGLFFNRSLLDRIGYFGDGEENAITDFLARLQAKKLLCGITSESLVSGGDQ